MVKYTFSAICLLGACSISPLQLGVVPPSLPEQWQNFSDEMVFLVQWWDGKSIRQKETSHHIIISLPPVTNSPVVVIPQWRGINFSSSAAFIPHDINDGKIKPQWKWGPTGEIFLTLLRERYPVMTFNLARFREEIGEMDNPWWMKPLLPRIISRRLRITDIREVSPISRTLSIPGTWISTNPFLSPVHIDHEAGEILLGQGLSYWIRKDKTMALRVLAGSDEVINVYQFYPNQDGM